MAKGALLSRRAALLALLAPTLAQARPTSRFVLKPPAGWTDLTNPEEVTSEIIEKLHPLLAIAAVDDSLLAFAVDLNAGADEKNSFMKAFLLPGELEVSTGNLPKIREALLRDEKPDVTIDVKRLEITELGEADVIKAFVSSKSDEGEELRLIYFIPGGPEQSLMLVYGATAAEFEKVRPLIEASAAATKGAVSLPRWKRWSFQVLPYLQLGAVVGILLMLLTRKRKPPVKPAPKPAPKKTEASGEDDGDDGDDAPDSQPPAAPTNKA